MNKKPQILPIIVKAKSKIYKDFLINKSFTRYKSLIWYKKCSNTNANDNQNFKKPKSNKIRYFIDQKNFFLIFFTHFVFHFEDLLIV